MDSLVLIVILGAALAGFVQGLSGSNFGLVAMAVWAWWLDPALIAPLVVCGSLVGQLLAGGALRSSFNLHQLLPMVGGGLLGVPLGVFLLHRLDPTLFRLAVGALLVLWCPLMLMARELPRIERGGRGADAAVGVLGGVMGGLGGLTGPAPALWATLRHWERDRQRATIQGFNLAMQALTMVTFVVSGSLSAQALTLFPAVALAVLLPTFLGLRLYRRFSDQRFRQVILGLLTLSGVVLLSTALPKLF
jgi:uncharacterized membrane protein YfcA